MGEARLPRGPLFLATTTSKCLLLRLVRIQNLAHNTRARPRVISFKTNHRKSNSVLFFVFFFLLISFNKGSFSSSSAWFFCYSPKATPCKKLAWEQALHLGDIGKSRLARGDAKAPFLGSSRLRRSLAGSLATRFACPNHSCPQAIKK